jgi:hypothetical protein
MFRRSAAIGESVRLLSTMVPTSRSSSAAVNGVGRRLDAGPEFMFEGWPQKYGQRQDSGEA